MCNATSAYFHDETAARKYLEVQRWPDGPVCVHCGGTERVYPVKADAEKKIREGLYHCNDCGQQFTVTVGTIYERSKVPLHKWLYATYLMCASKKGISSKQLERMLGVTYKTAWFMSHRIREAMREGHIGKLGGGGKIVEVDETYGNERKREKSNARAFHHKTKVLSLVERGGKVRSFHVPAVNAKTLKPILKEQIAADSHIMTDDAGQYGASNQFGRFSNLTDIFAKHDIVNHNIGEYVRGNISTNVVEGYFSIFKRGLMGAFHHVSEAHLKRYLCEFDFRYNYRESLGFNDMARFDAALRGAEGKRLTYRRPDSTY